MRRYWSVKFSYMIIAVAALALAVACSEQMMEPTIDRTNNPPANLDPYVQNERIGRAINLGNALEAPNEGDWGVVLRPEYFEIVKNAGFGAVRVPVRWSTRTSETAPYAIDLVFFARVDWVIRQAFDNDLAVIINIHHYEEIMTEPANHKDRFLGMWRQIAERYKNYDSDLFFEVLNEPNNNLTAALWNEYLLEAIDLIRETNPGRTLIVGTAEWGGIAALPRLELPAEDQNLIATIHYYNPFQFTHQGAEWVNGANAWLGQTWTGSTAQQQAVTTDFNTVKSWSETNRRPIFMGEFGAYSKADMDSRARWTAFVSREAETHGWSWAYWEFISGFGAYDGSADAWRDPLLNALIPPVGKTGQPAQSKMAARDEGIKKTVD